MPVRTTRRERRAEMGGPDRAVLVDQQDLAQEPVREMELAGGLVPLDRHAAGGSSGAIDQDHSYVPGPIRYSGSVSGPQLAVPSPRWAASRWTIVSARGVSSTSWVALARSAAR